MINVLEKEWHSYFVQLNEAEKKSILLMLKTFLQRKNTKENGDSLEQYNKEIDEALAEVKEGNYISQDEIERQASKW